MNMLLPAIEAALIAAGYRADIVPDPDAVPDALQPPFFTVADGGTTTIQDGLNETTEELTVILGTYYAAARVDQVIQGGGSREGLAAMHAAAIALLRDNDLGLPDIESVWPGVDQPARAFGTPEAPEFVRKQQPIVYQRVAT